jgi:hypothetical protein
MGIGKMFSDPGMLAKLAANPRTAKHLADASFMQKVCAFFISNFPARHPSALTALLAPTHTTKSPTGAEPP